MYTGPISKAFIAQYLPHNPVILEAGAHIGRDTIKMAKQWPSATIYAFEPVPALYAQLKENTKEYCTIHTHPLALHSNSGGATLFVSGGASTAASSLLEPSAYKTMRPEVTFAPTTVPTITLAQWAKDEQVSRVDFLWLDMQGAELIALQSGADLIGTARLILIEVNLIERFKNNPAPQEIETWLEARGFELIAKDLPKHNKQNLLFLKN